MAIGRTTGHATREVIILAILAVMAMPAAAQEPVRPQSDRITVGGGIDFLNVYAFRGIKQDDTGLIAWPSVNLGVRVYEGSGALKSFQPHRGHVEQPAQWHRRVGRAERPAVVRIGRSRRAGFRARRRRHCGNCVHRVHEPKRDVHHSEGDFSGVCGR